MDEGSQPPHFIALPEMRINVKPTYCVVRREPGSSVEVTGVPDTAEVGVGVETGTVQVGVAVKPPPIRVGVPV